MKIQTIDILQYRASQITCAEDRLFHQKSLPFLSVVQALEGSYGIGIGIPDEQQTCTMGVFIAPKNKIQYITHYIDKSTGVMRAHYVFLDVVINKVYRLDDLFDFPVLLPPQYNRQIYDIISGVNNNSNLCDNLSEIYKLIKILLAIGTSKNEIDYQMNEICQYIARHYAERITPVQLADRFALSVPTLFRKFKKLHGMTPSNYVNTVRLAQAVLLLEITNRPIGQICSEVGIEDVYYFCRLFKAKYRTSPSNHRKKTRSQSF